MNIPKGATHTSAGHYYRKFNGVWQLYGSGHAWIETACEQSWLDENTFLIADDREKVLNDLVSLIEGADAADKTIAEALYDAGYRKFEIVEEDV